MVEFCGEYPFWDWNRTWYTSNPDFTICFEDTALAWTPCVFLWLLAGLDVYYSLHSRGRNIPCTALNVSKLVTAAILCCIQMILFAYQMNRGYENVVYPVECYTPMIRFLTFGLVIFLILFSKIKGVRSSGVQFLFWLLMAICEFFAFRSAIIHSMMDIPIETTVVLVLRMIFYPVVLCEFFLSCWADAAPTYEEHPQISGKSCPEESASFLSRLLFFWFDSLAWKGYKKPLTYEDLWELNSQDKSSALLPAFDKHWRREMDNAKIKFWDNFGVPDTKASFRKRSGSIKLADSNKQKKKTQASILVPILKVFGPTVLLAAFLKLIQDLLTFVSPQILKLLIAYVSDNVQGEAVEGWKGYLYAILLLLTSVLQTILLNQYFNQMVLVGMRLRTLLISTIYKKSMLISSAARKESTVGEIVNLMSVDTQRLMDLTTYINMLWSGPLQIALSLYFLWGTLGPSVLAGFAVMLLLIPVNAFIAAKTKTLQIKQMKFKDQRVKLMNEILSGIKVLKLYAWELSFEEQIMEIRGKEMKVLKDAAYLNAVTAFIWTCAPFLVAVVSFASFVLSDPNNILDAELAFVSLSLFNILRFPLSMLPMIITSMVQANVSLKRINNFMNAEEINSNAVTHDSREADPIVIENGTFFWDPETTILRNISLRVKEGSLVALCGSVGSGKSSILSAILGEMEKETGRVNTKGSIAYVAQQAWIQNATLRDNILFGRPYQPTKYDQVVNACSLKPDLDVLTAGDKTEIGEKGINLSGGQKQRVSLARATYNNADVYLLDDPLSAVDSHVGKHIFENVLGPKGILKNKTRLLVTHGVTYLPQVDQIIVLKDGEITETGTYKELLSKKGAFAEFLVQHLGSDEIDEDDESSIIQDLEKVVGIKVERQRSRLSENEGSDKHILNRQVSITSQESGGERSSPRRRLSKSVESSIGKSSIVNSLPQRKDKLIEVEKSETGSVKMSVYFHYFRAVGWPLTIVTLLFHIIFQGFAVGANIWLSKWSNSNEGREKTNDTFVDTSERDMYLGVYAGLGVAQALAALLGGFCLFMATLISSASTHKIMLRRVFRSPMSFFETTPLGRILARFSKDVDTLDSILSQVFRGFLFCFLQVVATLAVVSITTPIFMSVILPIGVLYFLVQRFYVATSRQLKRLESVTRSPIYSHFGETIAGCTTIRAYSMQDRFISESETKVDYNQLSYFPNVVSNRWVAVRLETVGNFIVFFAAIFAVLQRDTLSAGTVGLSISYALNVTQALNWLVRMTSDVEANIVAVERIKEYSEIPQEAEWEINEAKPPITWPETGRITFNKYKTRYREGLDLVLRDVSCEIQSAEKIGIVGRTGAGKSSLTLALFRIIEAAGGSIVIDAKDISKLGLHDVRGRLTIIPQDPVLFSGTLRMNLDPFNAYSDEVIWHSLELAHLKSFVKGLASGLQHQISEGGDNLSVGQRQLICLARALLRKTKILVLDEATAAVDLETDDLIQQTIRSEFRDSTVVTIAHRLNTIMDSTRVMVLDKGEIREFDSPAALLKNKNSIFYGMAKDAGLL